LPTPRQIAFQFPMEAATIGGFGGLLGCSIGVVAVVIIAAAKGWTPTLDPMALIIAPGLGVVVGLAAGLLPAHKAVQIEPVDALRR
jgi:putative ABC transport system permease protein